MCKKSVILGLVLLLAGTALLGWVFTERRKEKQLQQQQRERLRTSLGKLGEMVGDEIDVRRFGDIIYDDNHNQESDKYKRREETRGLILTVSGVLTLTGGTILSWWLLLGTARLLFRGTSRLTRYSADLLRSRGASSARDKADPTKDKQLNQGDAKEGPNRQQRQAGAIRESPLLEKHSEVLVNSGWQNFNKNSANQKEPALSRTGFSTKSKASAENGETKCGPLPGAQAVADPPDVRRNESALGNQKLGVLLSDEASVEFEVPVKAGTEGPCLETLADSYENSLRQEDLLRAQAEDLEKQMAEFRQMAQNVQQSAVAHSKPLNDSLRELTQQVSAIREYAAHQQERVKKLQDGYDWNIIRNFCLRVIRCIDNLENRIKRLAKEDTDTRDLEEIRDELVFALESTGVERFEPVINSDYHGQEKNAEAVKDKKGIKDPKLKGKIAKVIRPGYQYFIDEENVKVVRTAKVKLYN